MGEEQFEVLMARLMSERQRLNELRAGYASVTKSRFHALRMLWFSLKALFGFTKPRDRYAVWSPSLNAGAGLGEALCEAEPVSDPAERHLIGTWNRRIGPNFPCEDPVVTIVIPVFNHRSVTARCLQSLADTWFDTLRVQIVVVDDGSLDRTCDMISRLPGIDYVRSGKNEGFIRACNRGAAIARGRHICFLNNDTVVTNGWLDHLVTTMESDPKIGIVGSKLIYPDGRLQEAGGIIWRDASGWNYGRFGDPGDPRYNYLRDADYVSAASLLVKADLFRALGGFSDEFRPAYYEDTDLCFGARNRGYRVVYQPLSEVIHYDGVSSATGTLQTKECQEVNRHFFLEKWQTELSAHFENDHRNVESGAARVRHGEVVLVIDSYVPLYDRESGSRRLFALLKMLRELKYTVIFLPDNYAGLQPYTRELQQMGVEVLHHIEDGRPMTEALASVLPIVDFAWICRPSLFHKYEALIRRNPAALLIYDTIDLHFVREQREAEVLADDSNQWQKTKMLELSAANSAAATIVVTEDEKAILEGCGVRDVHVIPNVHEVYRSNPAAFESTAGLLFIGNYHHVPNIDAATWLIREIMPLVWKSLPRVTVTLLGNEPPETVRSLASALVHVPGYVHDVSPYFEASRLFVAPLRFGAGMKGKIGQALEHALPVVTTFVGSEGLGLKNGANSLVVDSSSMAFADAVIRLYTDQIAWQTLSRSGPETIEPFTPMNVKPKLRQMMRDLSNKKLLLGDPVRS